MVVLLIRNSIASIQTLTPWLNLSGGGDSTETVIYETASATFDSVAYDYEDYSVFLSSYIKFVSDLEISDGDTISVTGTVTINQTSDYVYFLLGLVNANSNAESLFIEKKIETTTLTLNETFTWSNTYNETFFGFGVKDSGVSGYTDGYTLTDFKIAILNS